jgi:low temperature requirement protein LtrA
VFGGYLLAHAGLLDRRPLLLAGLTLMLAGWLAALIALGPILWRNRARDRHALSCFIALTLGLFGLGAFFAFTLGAPWVFAYIAIKVGRLAFLTLDTSAGRGRRLLLWFVASGVFWIAGGFADNPARTRLWIVALAIDLTGPMVLYWIPRRGRLPFGAWSAQTSHFVERFGLFMLIAFGETIVLTGAATSELGLTGPRFAGLTFAFLSAAAMWWLYFDDFTRVAKRRLEVAPNPIQLARDAYMYLHVVLVAGVILAAVGGELVIEHPTAVLADGEVAVRAAGPALYLLGHVLFRLRLTGRVSWERLGGAVACVFVGLIGTTVPALALAALLVSVLVAVIAIEHVRETRRLVRGAPSRFELLEDQAF